MSTTTTILVAAVMFVSAIPYAQVPTSERNALIALYEITNGSSWTNRTNWMGGVGTECDWYGVNCSEGSVQYLSLTYNNLTGGLPASLGDLANLQRLQLGSNHLNGNIPFGLGSLSNLENLELSGNDLTGSIPTELGNLGNLKTLFLGGNQLSGNIPSTLGNLSSLQTLRLDANLLTGSIPVELGNLSNLGSLSLYSNGLEGEIPPELGDISSLYFLSLSSNRLSGGIPASLGNLSGLYGLRLSSNQLDGGIPGELGNLSNLQDLYLDSNQLSGSIPGELGNLSSLQQLLLNDNLLEGEIPPQLGNLGNLQILYLQSNHLQGAIPSDLGDLTGLSNSHTDLGYNALWTDDPTIQAFLATKDPNWADTQTIAPSDTVVDSSTSSSLTLVWTPILYTANPGHYEVRSPDGTIFSDGFETGDTSMWEPETARASLPTTYVTLDKTDGSLLIDGLQPGVEYEFVIRTVTDPHSNNQNQVTSEDSAVITATTEQR